MLGASRTDTRDGVRAYALVPKLAPLERRAGDARVLLLHETHVDLAGADALLGHLEAVELTVLRELHLDVLLYHSHRKPMKRHRENNPYKRRNQSSKKPQKIQLACTARSENVGGNIQPARREREKERERERDRDRGGGERDSNMCNRKRERGWGGRSPGSPAAPPRCPGPGRSACWRAAGT